MLVFNCVPYEMLSLDLLYRILQLRQEVFIVEQNCPYIDCDNKDLNAFHLYATDENNIVQAYARLIPAEVSYPGYCSIGRVLTSLDLRGAKAGKALMQEALYFCEALFGRIPIKISAQSYLLRFYSDFGFVSTGKSYLEDGIPHTEMIFSYT